jgi:predicted DNA-binding transcriptional regulator
MNYLIELKVKRLKVKDIAKEMGIHPLTFYRKNVSGFSLLEREWLERRLNPNLQSTEPEKPLRTPENKPDKTKNENVLELTPEEKLLEIRKGLKK